MSLKATIGSAKNERRNCAVSRARRSLKVAARGPSRSIRSVGRYTRVAIVPSQAKPSQVADDVDYEGRKICAEVSHAWILMEDRDCWSSVRVLAAFDPTTESDVWIVWPGLRASDNMKSS
jgi:hypothetical protein